MASQLRKDFERRVERAESMVSPTSEGVSVSFEGISFLHSIGDDGEVSVHAEGTCLVMMSNNPETISSAILQINEHLQDMLVHTFGGEEVGYFAVIPNFTQVGFLKLCAENDIAKVVDA